MTRENYPTLVANFSSLFFLFPTWFTIVKGGKSALFISPFGKGRAKTIISIARKVIKFLPLLHDSTRLDRLVFFWMIFNTGESRNGEQYLPNLRMTERGELRLDLIESRVFIPLWETEIQLTLYVNTYTWQCIHSLIRTYVKSISVFESNGIRVTGANGDFSRLLLRVSSPSLQLATYVRMWCG